MATTFVSVEGLREIDAAMDDLTKASAKGVLRRSGIKALEPMAEVARGLAPDNPATGAPDLGSSIAVGTKLSKRQAGLHRKMFRDDKASAEVFMGPGPDPAAWNQEFGNVNHGPQPFMRPAWDGGKDRLLKDLQKLLWAEIDKAAARAARKAARLKV